MSERVNLHVGSIDEMGKRFARTLGRDYKRVHEDVSALARAGLIVRDENGIRAPYDSVQATVCLAA